MSKSTTTADIKSVRDKSKAIISAKFPRGQLLTQFEKMAQATGSEAEHATAKRETAYVVCKAALAYRIAAHGKGKGQSTDVSTIMDSWRENWKTLISELHAKQSPFVELGEANKKDERKPVMTGYGRNVASTARGVIEFAIPVTDAKGKSIPYTEITKLITVARRKALPRDKRTLNAAQDVLSETLQVLRGKMGNSAETVIVFTAIVKTCLNCFTNHQHDGLVAIDLTLEEMDLAALLEVIQLETVATNDDETGDSEAAETDETPVQTGNGEQPVAIAQT